MSNASANAHRLRLLLGLRWAAFLSVFYLLAWLRFDVGLTYYGHKITTEFPVFSRGAVFLRESMANPGGLVRYASSALSQLYSWPWAGALVVTLMAAALCLTARGVITALSGWRSRLVHFVPALIVLGLCGRYAHALAACLAIVVASALTCLYAWLPVRRALVRFLAFVVLSAALYCAAGAACLLFGILCVLFELARMRRHALAGACFLVGAAIPYVIGRQLFLVPVRHAYGGFLPRGAELYPWTELLVACLWLSYVLVPVAAAAFSSLPRVRARGRRAETADAVAVTSRGGWLWLAGTAALMLVTAAVAFFSLDRDARSVLRIQRYAAAEQWQDLLREVRRLPPERMPLLVLWDQNSALYHTGQLPYRTFAYPQHPLGLLPTAKLFPVLKLTKQSWLKLAQLLLELGRVNEAERAAYEAFESLGDRAVVLRLMALISTVKGEAEAAGILLRALSRDLVHGGWARDRLRMLEEDPQLSADPEVGRLRSSMVLEDRVRQALRFDEILRELLARNSQNRMAFEYLMAHYLLTRNLEGIAENIGRLDDFDYPSIPRHYEEALVILTARGGRKVELGHRSLSWETLGRYGEFTGVLARHAGETREAKRAAVQGQGFGDSYFTYYWLGPQGLTP